MLLLSKYLKDNPKLIGLSSRELSKIEVEGNRYSHTYWNKAKKLL